MKLELELESENPQINTAAEETAASESTDSLMAAFSNLGLKDRPSKSSPLEDSSTPAKSNDIKHTEAA